MDFKKQAKVLVEGYIKPQGVSDPKILKAFLDVPRHQFIPYEYRDEAYFDIALPIGKEQTISQPSLVAIMTQALNLKGHEKVLEIGTGSGYQAAILSKLAKEVFSVEIIPALAASAKKILKKLKCTNVQVITANGSLGFPEKAPYDAIIVTAGAQKMPIELIGQLKPGGRIVIPIGKNQFSQKLVIGTKKGHKLQTQEIEQVAFVPLVGKYLREKG